MLFFNHINQKHLGHTPKQQQQTSLNVRQIVGDTCISSQLFLWLIFSNDDITVDTIYNRSGVMEKYFCSLSLFPVVLVIVIVQIYHHPCFHIKQQLYGRKNLYLFCIFSHFFLVLLSYEDSITTASIEYIIFMKEKTIAMSCVLSHLLLFSF